MHRSRPRKSRWILPRHGPLSRRCLLSLAAGVHDTWQRTAADVPAEGYSILFLAGCAAGLIGIVFLSRIPEPRLETCRQVPVAALFRESLADRNFRHLLSFLALWNFAINLAAPFFTVYLLTILGLDVALVVALAVLSQVVSVASFHLWAISSTSTPTNRCCG